jgi:hypothetical protein
MALSFLPLTLSTVRDIFVEDILPLVLEGGHEHGTLDRALLTGLERALGEKDPAAGKADTPIEAGIAQGLSRFGNLTEGARVLVQESRTLDTAILAILADKGIRAYLRSSIRDEFKIKRLNQLLMHLEFPEKALAATKAIEDKTKALEAKANAAKASAGKFGVAMSIGRQIATTLAASSAKVGNVTKIGLPAAQSKPPAAAPAPSTARNPTPTLPTRANTLSANARSCLAPYLARPFNYQWAKKPHPCTVEGLIASLETYDDALQAPIRAALTGLFQSDIRFLLPVILELSDSGDLTLAPAALALAKIFTARLYMQLNAIESAEKVAQDLRDTPVLLKSLPDGEKRRLEDLMAHCALRSGRARDAIQMYGEMAIQRPDDPRALISYIASVYTNDLPEALSYAKLILLNQYAVSNESLIFIGDLLAHNDQTEYALSAFYRILQRSPDYADAYLGIANIALVERHPDKWSKWLKKFGQFHKLTVTDASDSESLAPFRFRSEEYSQRTASPKVSVIMTSFNSSKTLVKAVNSVLRQSVSNLELFIVDDHSTDDSREIIQALAAAEPRVQYIFNERNMGTYASKNQAILKSTGQFITFHDSDDWMHPLRLETQLDAMKNSSIMCSTSNWIRMDEFGRTIVRRGGPYTHLNPASTFFRRDVFSKLGLFDSVRTGADSEILTRIRHRLGHSVVLQLPAVLGMGLHHEVSLTQSGATAFDEHRYSPVRLAYTESWVKWHLSTLKAGRDNLSLTTESGRPFDIPDSIAP